MRAIPHALHSLLTCTRPGIGSSAGISSSVGIGSGIGSCSRLGICSCVGICSSLGSCSSSLGMFPKVAAADGLTCSSLLEPTDLLVHDTLSHTRWSSTGAASSLDALLRAEAPTISEDLGRSGAVSSASWCSTSLRTSGALSSTTFNSPGLWGSGMKNKHMGDSSPQPICLPPLSTRPLSTQRRGNGSPPPIHLLPPFARSFSSTGGVMMAAEKILTGDGLSPGFYDSTVEKYAQQPLEMLTMAQMIEFGRQAWSDSDRMIKSAHYVQRELPKRLARRLMDLQLLPHIVVMNPHISKVYAGYFHSFEVFRRFPMVKSLDDNKKFVEILRAQLDSHALMLDALASGLRECKSKELVGTQLQLDPFFDAMLRSRISRRVMAEQHLHINDKKAGYIGVICESLDVGEAVHFAAQKARQVCMETYGVAPDVHVSGDAASTIPYIPTHLDYMLYEVLKNSCRAVAEFHHGNGTFTSLPFSSNTRLVHNEARGLPPIHIRICSSNDGITIRVSDQGGGVPEEIQDRIWSYGFTTVGHTTTSDNAQQQYDEMGQTVMMLNTRSRTQPPSGKDESLGAGLDFLSRGAGQVSRFQIAGLGFGLPLSRLYARYFHGDIRLQVIPGYGTDAHVYIKRLDTEWLEKTE